MVAFALKTDDGARAELRRVYLDKRTAMRMFERMRKTMLRSYSYTKEDK